jgi:DNA repair protein RecO (recombination protein O)
MVINTVKFRETSLIVKAYTEKFGLRSLLINGVRSAKSKTNKIALFQPLTHLELVIYYQEQQQINRISEARMVHPFHEIPFHSVKTGMAIFLAEILGKVLKEEESNPPLFQFITRSLAWFDAQPEGYENFHVHFLLKLPAYLGFGIYQYADILQGPSGYVFPEDPATEQLASQLIRSDYSNYFPANRLARKHLLEMLIAFYQFHLDQFGEVRSLEILSALYQNR